MRIINCSQGRCFLITYIKCPNKAFGHSEMPANDASFKKFSPTPRHRVVAIVKCFAAF